MIRAETVKTLSENTPYHIRGERINYKAFVALSCFEIPVNGERSHKIAASAFNIKRGAGFNGNIAAVRFIDNVLYGNGQIIGFIVQGIDIIIYGNKPNPISGEHSAKIPSCFDVLTTEPRQILDNNAICFARFYHLHHFQKRGAVIRRR